MPDSAARPVGRAEMRWAETLRPVATALAVALVLAVAKAVVFQADYEVLPANPLVSAVVGGVIFTLAILLGGVLQDYKEAERNVGELAGQLRRLHWDLAFIGLSPGNVDAARAHLRDYGQRLRTQLRRGRRLSMREIMAPLAELDRLVVREVKIPGSAFRTLQIAMGTFQRVTERLETIIETTFMQAGYVFAVSAMGLVLTTLLFTPIAGPISGPTVYGMVGFVLAGLFLIVRDMDNPFEGAARVSMAPLEKAVADLEQLAAPSGAGN